MRPRKLNSSESTFSSVRSAFLSRACTSGASADCRCLSTYLSMNSEAVRRSREILGPMSVIWSLPRKGRRSPNVGLLSWPRLDLRIKYPHHSLYRPCTPELLPLWGRSIFGLAPPGYTLRALRGLFTFYSTMRHLRSKRSATTSPTGEKRSHMQRYHRTSLRQSVFAPCGDGSFDPAATPCSGFLSGTTPGEKTFLSSAIVN